MTFDEGLRVAQIIVGIGVVAIGAWVKTAIGRITDRMERLESRADASDVAVAATRASITNVQNAGVKREDWIRDSARFRQTMERLVEGQSRLEGRLDIGTRLVSSIERLAAATNKKAETDG